MNKKLLRLNLQHFAEDTSTTDNTSNTDNQQTDDKTDNPFGAQDKNQTDDKDKDPDKQTDDTSQGGDNKDKEPSSEEVQKQAADAYAKTQGYESAEKMQEALKAYKEYQDSQKTEQERQQEKLTNLEKDTQAKDEQLQNANAQISAMKKGVDGEFLEDVILLAKAKTSDDVTMDDAIGQVLERYPHFKGEQQQGQGPSFGQDKYQQQSGGSDDFVAGLNLKSIAGGKQ